jgi:hypothetical protein
MRTELGSIYSNPAVPKAEKSAGMPGINLRKLS